jgi:hypothetical protein
MRPAPTNPPTPLTRTQLTVPTASVFETTGVLVDSGGDDDAGVSEAGIDIRVQSNRMQSSQGEWV